ncbi:hypothetical protein CSC12_1677 [Klebsiella michiganensis]|nr:hypothetical protein CSC12_1677 [Klebsiella michiganensis]
MTGDVGRKLRHHANDIINNKKTKNSQYFHSPPSALSGRFKLFFLLERSNVRA